MLNFKAGDRVLYKTRDGSRYQGTIIEVRGHPIREEFLDVEVELPATGSKILLKAIRRNRLEPVGAPS